jgi:hypothetical protein
MAELDITVPIRSEIVSQKSWPWRMKASPKIQRAFDRWYRASEARFAIKLEFIRRTDSCLTFGFQGVRRIIDVSLSYDLSVHVTWEDTSWDMLLSLDAYPKRVPGGYACTECAPATRQTFSNREALWEYELFEPFLEWVNDKLAPADALHLYGKGGMTMAKLTTAEPNRNNQI